MARAKSSEQPRARTKAAAAEEVSRGIEKLRELSAQIDDLSREGFPYRDAVLARTELSLRETIRRIFGEKSPEYQANKAHKLRTGNKAEAAQSIGLLKELIATLETQKAELLGLKPSAAEASPIAQHPTLTPVPPSPAPVEIPHVPAPVSTVAASLAATIPPVATAPTPVESHTAMAAPAPAAPPPVQAPQAEPIPAKDSSLRRPIQQAPSSPLLQTAVPPAASTPAAVIVPKTDTAPVTPPSPPVEVMPAKSSEPESSIKPSTLTLVAPAVETQPPRASLSPEKATPEPVAAPMPLNPPVAGSTEQLDRPQVLPLPSMLDAPAGVKPPTLSRPDILPMSDQPSTDMSRTVKVDTARIPRSISSSSVPAQPGATSLVDSTIPPAKIEPPAAPPRLTTIPPVAEQQVKIEAPPTPTSAAPVEESESHQLLRRLCTRFHLVARQLRLRNEYRPTLEIEDEEDLQDLFYALLRLQFDEVGVEEWTPPYAEGKRRASYLLDRERTMIVVKKTRSGLNARNLADQLKTDQIHFEGRGDGRTLFCFIYDPEGRVGNPRGLESDLTSVSDSLNIEVIVAPK